MKFLLSALPLLFVSASIFATDNPVAVADKDKSVIRIDKKAWGRGLEVFSACSDVLYEEQALGAIQVDSEKAPSGIDGICRIIQGRAKAMIESDK